MSRLLGWIFPFLLALGFVGPIPLHRVIREIEDYQNIEAAYTNYTANEVCFSEMHVYQRGDVVPNAGPCEECRCEPPSIVCQMTKCPVNSNGCRTIQRPNHCCPDYNCDCEYGDRIYNDGEKIDTAGECQVCYCKGGEVMCTTIACYTRADCEPTHLPGQCCPTYQNCPLRDPNGFNGEEKAVPKREMQPWLLTNTETHTAPHIALTDATNKDLSTLPTTPVEIISSENIPSSVRETEHTSAKPVNLLDEVVFTRVENNNSSPQVNQEHILEPEIANKLKDLNIMSTETTENFETTTVLDDMTTTELVREDSTEKLGNIQAITDISQTSSVEKLNYVSKEANIIEERLFSTTTVFDEDIPSTIQTFSQYKTVDDEVETTEPTLESTTVHIDILGEDISQDLLDKYEHKSENAESIPNTPKNAAPIQKIKEYNTQNHNLLSETPPLEETTYTPTTEESKSSNEEMSQSTKLHPEEIFKHSTEMLGKFIIGENSLDEPKKNLEVKENVMNEEFPPLVITNSVEYFTTVPSVSKYTDHLNQENKLKLNTPDHVTTQHDIFFTTDMTTEITTDNSDNLGNVLIHKFQHKEKGNSDIKIESEPEKNEKPPNNEREVIDSASSSKISNIMDNRTNIHNIDQSNVKEEVETSESRPVEIEIISHDGDEESTQRIVVTSSESDEDGDPVIIDIVNEDGSNESRESVDNVPPILELNSHVPFLQLGEDSSEETTDVEGLATQTTSGSTLKPEKLLQIGPKPSLTDLNDILREEEIADNLSTSSDGLKVDGDVISSTPIISLTPGDLKALAEFMIKEKIKPTDEKAHSMYKPNQWLEGNLTSEEKIASIMSAASVTVGLINRTGSEKSIVPLEAIRNKNGISHLSDLNGKSTHESNSSPNRELNQALNKFDGSKVKDVFTTANTLAEDSSEAKEITQIPFKTTNDKEVVSTLSPSERLVEAHAIVEKNKNRLKKEQNDIDRTPALKETKTPHRT